MSKLFWIIIVVICGALIPIQAGLNAAFKKVTHNGLLAGCWNTTLATIIFILALLTIKKPLPNIATLSTIPWWGYLGGVCGAFYVFTSLASAHKLGAILLIVCLTAGQMIGSVIIDHFGLIGYEIKSITIVKFIGILCVILGIYLIQK